MKNAIRRLTMLSALLAASLFLTPAFAADDVKQVVKEGCSQAGGTYSSGSNYARCQYSNGDSYTCNTDVNQCESCTNGKCTVAIKRPGMGIGPAANMQNARPSPSKPTPAMAPAGMMHKQAQ